MPIVSQERYTKPPLILRGTWMRRRLDGPFQQTAQVSESYGNASRGRQRTDSFRGSSAADYEAKSGPDLRRDLHQEKKLRFDTGHNFYTHKEELTSSPIKVNMSRRFNALDGRPWELSYSGDFSIPISTFSDSYFGSLSNFPTASTMEAYGRRFIRQTTPTAPEAALATLLGELSQRRPELPGTQLFKKGSPPKKGGSEYLNWEFGLAPLIREVQTLAKAAADSARIIEQMKRDAGRNVRRRASAPPVRRPSQYEEFTWDPTYSVPRSPWVDFGIEEFIPLTTSWQSKVRVHTSIEDMYSFSGAYTYYLHQADDLLGRFQEYEQKANRVLGSSFTAETAWELTPWSWLIDWKFDVGTTVSNLVNLHSSSSVLRYGYVMAFTRQNRVRTVTGIPRHEGVVGLPSTVSTTGLTTCKQRIRASPYGFGLNPSSFNSKQWAILAALGMTKGDRSMRWLSS